jgi:hypothetical protein
MAALDISAGVQKEDFSDLVETAQRGGLSNREFLQENSRILGKSIKNADALFSGG